MARIHSPSDAGGFLAFLESDYSAEAVAVAGIYRIPLTINASQVAENAVNFPVFVDLSAMPDEFWDHVRADGGDIRAYTAGGSTSGTPLALELVHVDAVLQRGELWVKVPSVSTASDTAFCLEVGDPALTAQPAATDPLGSQAVWPSEYAAVYHLHRSLLDATANGRHMTEAGTSGTVSGDFAVTGESPDVGSHQGVCFDGTHYYVVDTNAIKKYDGSWNLVSSNSNPLGDIAGAGGPTLNHLGDPTIKGGVLYLTAEDYFSNCGVGTGNVHVARFSASTLGFLGITDLSATATEGSSVCFVPATHSPSGSEELWVANYCTAGRVHRYDAATYAHLGNHDYTGSDGLTLRFIQGIAFYGGSVYINTTEGWLFEASPAGGGALRVLFADSSVGVASEGIWVDEDADGLRVLALREVTGVSQKVRTLRPAAVPSTAGASGFQTERSRHGQTSSFLLNQDPISFTCYASLTRLASNAVVVSYLDTTQAGSVNQRAVLAFRASTGKWGLWDKTNAWLDGTTAVALYTWYRLTETLNPGGNRRLLVNGVQEASGAIAALPTGLRNVWLGREDSDGSENLAGAVTDLFVRTVEVSSGRDLTEHRNRTQFATFITVGAAVEV